MPSDILAASVALLTVAGGGVAFVWNKIEQRFRHIEHDLEQCRKRETFVFEQAALRLTIIELLWAEVIRLAPKSAALTRVKKLLDDVKQDAINRDHRRDGQ